MADPEDEASRRAQQRVGQLLKEKWHVDRVLGIGGFGAVYAATHRTRKRVAVKILHPEVSVSAEMRGRFLREAYAANSVDHPGVVSVFDDDVAEDGSAFLVMELCEGEAVDVRAERMGGRLPVSEVIFVADQVLDVLVAAHDKGILHRDLKPANLFLTRGGQLKVLDFGIARFRETDNMTSTRSGHLMGTPAFMPPEQARGEWRAVDGRTDLWAVGATMFTLLTGSLVHEARSTPELLVFSMTRPARPISSVMPGVPGPLAHVVDRALAFDKDARWPDARQMQAALRHAASAVLGTPVASAPRVEVPGLTPGATPAPFKSRADIVAFANTLAAEKSAPAPAATTEARPAGSWGRGLALAGGVLVAAGGLAVGARIMLASRSAAPAAASVAETSPAASSPAPPATAAAPAATPPPAVAVEPAAAPTATAAAFPSSVSTAAAVASAPGPRRSMVAPAGGGARVKPPDPAPTMPMAAPPADPFSKRR